MASPIAPVVNSLDHLNGQVDTSSVLGSVNQSVLKKEIQDRTIKIICKTACKPGLVLQGIKVFVPLDRVEAVGTHGRNT